MDRRCRMSDRRHTHRPLEKEKYMQTWQGETVELLTRITKAEMKVWARKRQHEKGKAEMDKREGKIRSTAERFYFPKINELIYSLFIHSHDVSSTQDFLLTTWDIFEVALFYAITINSDWIFQAPKRMTLVAHNIFELFEDLCGVNLHDSFGTDTLYSLEIWMSTLLLMREVNNSLLGTNRLLSWISWFGSPKMTCSWIRLIWFLRAHWFIGLMWSF